MRTPFPTEKRERNIKLICDFANGMGNKELTVKYEIGATHLNHVIRATCRTVNRKFYYQLQNGDCHFKVPMSVLRENKQMFAKENHH
jgi:hypothetical protein